MVEFTLWRDFDSEGFFPVIRSHFSDFNISIPFGSHTKPYIISIWNRELGSITIYYLTRSKSQPDKAYILNEHNADEAYMLIRKGKFFESLCSGTLYDIKILIPCKFEAILADPQIYQPFPKNSSPYNNI